MKLKKVALDKDKEKKGIWVPWQEDARLLIARLGNPEYVVRNRELAEEFGPQLRAGGDLRKKTATDMFNVLLSETILLGWEKIEDDSGPVEYTPASALRLLITYDLLRDFVIEQASEATRYVAAEDQGGQKN